jgi:5-methylthioadenosine/S-adenosylhomocysteine deaminase
MVTIKRFFLLTLVFLLFAFFLQAQKPRFFDILISNTTIVDVINKKVVPAQWIGITDGTIVWISSHDPRVPFKRMIDGSRLVALPGFVNTHTHLWQHICKGCFPNESLQNWVGVYTKIHYLESQELYDVVLAASNEALLSGITTVSDYASSGFNDYGFESNARAMRDAGLGGIIVWNNPSIYLPDYIKLQEIRRYQQEYQKQFSLWMGFGPLSFYSLQQVYSGIRLAEQLQLPMTEHTMENNAEQRDFYDSLKSYVTKYKAQLSRQDSVFFTNLLNLRKPSENDAYEALVYQAMNILETDERLKTRKGYLPLTNKEKESLVALLQPRNFSPIAVLDYFKVLPRFLSIHSVWLQKEDIEIMKSNDASISHNPESNLYLSSGLAPIQDYLAAGLTVSLGTDGAASNDAIDFFSAMKTMWNMVKLRILQTPASKELDQWTVLQAATINGAKALGLDKVTGSINVGKQADLSLLSLDELGMSPSRLDEKLVTLLIYSASPRNIKYVLSDGSVLVEAGRLKKYSEQSLAQRLTRIALNVDKRIATGKLWKESETLKKFSRPYWYKYRSIRTRDSIDFNFLNQSDSSVRFIIASSSLVFSGGSPYVVSKEVSDRFPDQPLPTAFKQEISLNKGQRIRITKRKNSFEYIIHFDGKTYDLLGARGQLLFFCEPEKIR